MSEIEILAAKIKEAKDAYYNLDPIMSDAEYDALFQKLKSLDSNNAEITSVGSPAKDGTSAKVKHQIPMGSLNKVNSKEEFSQWVTRISGDDVYISHKLDGLSMEVVFKDGKFISAVTRGDGIEGEDATKNVSLISDIPHKINMQDCVIRGEVIMLKSVFQKNFAGKYANPRNTAAAKIREKKSDESKYLSFRPYFIYADGQKFSSMEDMLNTLSKLGFSIPTLAAKVKKDEIESVYESQKTNRSSLEYEIDGLVISSNSMDEINALGEVNMRPEGQIAWKFDALMGITKAIEIKWQTGPTGRVAPILIVEPVDVGGVSISRVSLQNLDNFKSLNLFKGCRVLISRRNDVIPYCEKNLDDNV